jgi:hypothetical protein
VLKAALKLPLYNEGATNASQMINNDRTWSTLAIEFFRHVLRGVARPADQEAAAWATYSGDQAGDHGLAFSQNASHPRPDCSIG